MKIAVLGTGDWSTAITRLLTNKGYGLVMYTDSEDQYKVLQESKENPAYLPGVSPPEDLSYTLSLKCVEETGIIVSAIPTSACREVLGKIKEYSLREDVIPVNLAKGIENKSLKRVSEISEEILGDLPFVCLSGPSHAEEVAKDIFTRVTVVCQDVAHAYKIRSIFSTENFRVYTNHDLVGVELGGALKDIIVLAAGISDGLKFGDSTKAALVTRGMYEISKPTTKTGGDPQIFHGLAGMGDLIVTYTSMYSRSRRYGTLIGQGLSVEEASCQAGVIVEGVETTRSAYDPAKKLPVDMLITNKLYGALYENKNPLGAVKILVTRDSKDETEEVFFL